MGIKICNMCNHTVGDLYYRIQRFIHPNIIGPAVGYLCEECWHKIEKETRK